ncbi:hypothetical protein AB6A40_008506 [Gnathostoma spinigerum]|uniref:Beta-catenin-like protein 1 N-terminal domain-containing protein n=1 Tax=Gnathostoma spinigerum TaxID=75299 RepID=A0ABD6EYM1_9BILA
MASIDVTEILRASAQPPAKRSRNDDVTQISVETSNTADILAALESDNSQAMVIDELAAKKLVLQLERRCAKNREMRIKYADDPGKFMESEVDLNQAIQVIQF